MKRLLALLGCFSLVWTQDHDGEVRLRIAHRNPFGEWACNAIGPPCSVILNPDGTTRGKYYVRRWMEWKHNRCHVIFSDGTVEREVKEPERAASR